MKTALELAAIFDEWAKSNETTAEEILACLDSLSDVADDEVREHQRSRADQLVAEAAALKRRAAELRQFEAPVIEELQVVRKTAHDRGRSCDRPRTIWRYNHFR